MSSLRRVFGLSFSITHDVAQILKRQLLWMLLLRIVLYTLLLGLSYVLSELRFNAVILPKSALVILLMAVYIATIISALILLRLQENIQKFGFFQSILDTLFATVLIYFTGISGSIFTSVYFFAIITGGLILPRRGGLIAAAASTLLYGSILFLEYRGFFPGYFLSLELDVLRDPAELINLFAAKGLTFFLAALLSAMFGMRLVSTEEVLTDTIESYDKLSHLHKTIFDNISTGIITTNERNNITSANNAARSITGYRLAELIGRNIEAVFPNLNLASRSTRQAIDFVTRDDRQIRIGYSITSLNIPSDQTAREDVYQSEESSKLITLQDISEIEKLENKIRQGEKMAAIGMMSAGIAHDFRNPLTAISGSAQILANEFSRNSGTSENENLVLTRIILRESNRLIETISDFLKFARPDVAERQWFQLSGCIEEVLQVCRATPDWPASCRVEIDIDPRTDIWADEKQFFTLASHLIQNAIIFCPKDRERIRIRTEERKTAGNIDEILVYFEDNGTGIEEEMRDKVFEPFYTSRADGTGLGLALARQIAEAHKGSISISDSPLGGALFIVTLPLF